MIGQLFSPIKLWRYEVIRDGLNALNPALLYLRRRSFHPWYLHKKRNSTAAARFTIKTYFYLDEFYTTFSILSSILPQLSGGKLPQLSGGKSCLQYFVSDAFGTCNRQQAASSKYSIIGKL